MFRSVSNKHSANSRNITIAGLPATDILGATTNISTDGRTIITTQFSEDVYDFNKTRLIDAVSGQQICEVDNPTGANVGAISARGEIFAIGAGFGITGYPNGAVLIYNRSGTQTRIIDRPEGIGTYFGREGIALSDDGSIIAIGLLNISGQPDRVYIINTNTGALLRTFLDPDGAAASFSGFGELVALSGDGSIVAILNNNFNSGAGKILVYNTNTGTLITSFVPPAGSFSTLSITADGQQVLTSADGNIIRYSAVTGATLQSYSVSGLGSKSAKISRDGSTIAVADQSEARIFVGLNTTPVKTLTLTPHPYMSEGSIGLSGDGSRLAASGNDFIQFEQLF